MFCRSLDTEYVKAEELLNQFNVFWIGLQNSCFFLQHFAVAKSKPVLKMYEVWHILMCLLFLSFRFSQAESVDRGEGTQHMIHLSGVTISILCFGILFNTIQPMLWIKYYLYKILHTKLWSVIFFLRCHPPLEQTQIVRRRSGTGE